MNLEDIIDPEYGLQQDEWSLTARNFGDNGQLEVVGWSGKYRGVKYYILKCTNCSADSELFGEGYFNALKSNLLKGQVPCGCSRIPKWTKEQYGVICARRAEELGYVFLGFNGSSVGASTKIRMLCKKHGDWDSGTVDKLINGARGCPKCATDKKIACVRLASTKPDEVMIASFFASGAFHPDTKFWRSERRESRGRLAYWYTYCPECEGIGESQSGNLQLGRRSCYCNTQRQQEGYINLVMDCSTPIAVKFGITNNVESRVRAQNYKSCYDVINFTKYIFDSVESCKKAERDCKKELQCGVLGKEEMPDGYTETTWLYNLDKIIEIYERNGGIINETK